MDNLLTNINSHYKVGQTLWSRVRVTNVQELSFSFVVLVHNSSGKELAVTFQDNGTGKHVDIKSILAK